MCILIRVKCRFVMACKWYQRKSICVSLGQKMADGAGFCKSSVASPVSSSPMKGCETSTVWLCGKQAAQPDIGQWVSWSFSADCVMLAMPQRVFWCPAPCSVPVIYGPHASGELPVSAVMNSCHLTAGRAWWDYNINVSRSPNGNTTVRSKEICA